MEETTNQQEIEVIHIPTTEYGKRIDSVLSILIPSLTRVQIKRLFCDKKITVNGRYDKPSRSVKGGETVKVELPAPVAIDLEPENIEIEYIYEDNDIIVLNKPSGISVHPGAGIDRGTLVNAILYKTKDLSGIGGKIRPGLVHRLDKDTTGIMIVAKNDLAHHSLSEQFKKKNIQKKYLALIIGNPKENSGIITLSIGRHKIHRKKISSQTNKPRPSTTKWKVVKRYKNIAFIEAEPLTGRTHQIRVHLSESGFPILGDKIYGTKKYPDKLTKQISELFNRQALHAYSLKFNHPVRNIEMKFDAPLPKDFSESLSLLDRNG